MTYTTHTHTHVQTIQCDTVKMDEMLHFENGKNVT